MKKTILLAVAVLFATPVLAQGGDPYPVREDRAPYIQNPTQTSVEIAWRTIQEQVGLVEYQVFGSNDVMQTYEDTQIKKHHVMLSDLQAGTRYKYSVYSGDQAVLEGGSFETAPEYNDDSFSFLLLGDSGVNTDEQWEVARQMQKHSTGADFVVHVGDVHQDLGDYYDDVFFKPYANLISGLNVFTSLGNHDVITDDGGIYLDDFYLPHNNPDNTERYYSFRWGTAYFIALDTNQPFYPLSPQHSFLVDALNDPMRLMAEWTFVYMHHPPYTEHDIGPYGVRAIRDFLVPVFESHGVDMVMAGHVHCYERGFLNGVYYITSGGGGGSLREWRRDYSHIDIAESLHHFARIDLRGSELEITAIDRHGRVFDKYIIEKAEPLYAQDVELLGAVSLVQNYPNPFNPSTTITYTLDRSGPVEITVYDLTGRLVTTLVDGVQPAGHHEVRFNADGLPTGTYVYRLRAGTETLTRTMILVR